MVRKLRTRFLALSIAFCAAAAVPAQAQLPSLDSEQALFLTLINNFRAQNGAGPLQVSVTLQNASQWMSADMAAKNYFSHTDSLGRSAFQRMAAFGYPYAPAGENLAAGYSGAQNTFNQWQGSTGHRANMLNPGYRVIGIGRAYSQTSPYGWYWTTDFGGYVDEVLGGPGSPTLPAISFFGASPSAVLAGQATTLAWSVSGATSIAIDNGIGDVTGLTSKMVLPARTTTYRLTATNAGGSVTAQTTVTVNSPTADTQPPTAPGFLWAAAASATRVNLTWTASVDNVGVAGYQIVRSGWIITSVPGSATSYADTSAAAGATYTYAIRAYDAAGNVSALTYAAPVTTPASPAPSGPASIAVAGGSPQSATVGAAFASALQARVLNASSQPVAGVAVTFTAPVSGASGTFAGSANVATALTDATGIARSPSLTANQTAGSFTVAATVPGLPAAAFSLTNTAVTTTPPASGATSIWGNLTPPNRYTFFSGPVELGVKFRSGIAGKIVGIRFYKNSGNGGVHTGSLWTAGGQRLATGTFVNETASGWQTLLFATPVAIAANTTYVASYHTSSGNAAIALSYFDGQEAANGTLRALQHGADGSNGVLLPSPGGQFPSMGTPGHNYWVDVIFAQ
jgi:uncharacterized protein YkwD